MNREINNLRDIWLDMTWNTRKSHATYIKAKNRAYKQYQKAISVFHSKYDCSIIDLDLTSKVSVLKAIKKLENKERKYEKLGMLTTDTEMIIIANTIKGLQDVTRTI